MIVLLINILSAILTSFYAGMIIYLRRGWERIPYFRSSGNIPQTRVSILIAARNEEGKIERTILDILAQDYPSDLMELIVVDDNSTDRTPAIIADYVSRGVRLIRLNEHEKLNSYKKKAITEAMQLASGELIITTDADCRMGLSWLSTIVSFYEAGSYKMVSSPVVYFEEKSSFERIQTLEFLFLIGLGAAGIGNKKPSTCNGANLAYRRDIFFELKGFNGIDNLASGDDELFMHKVATAYPDGIGFCKSRSALVYTHAKHNLKNFIRQRQRWASKSTKYKNKWIVFLGISVWLFNLMILVNLVAGFYNPAFWKTGLMSLLVKVIFEFLFLIPLCNFAQRRALLLYQPFTTFIHIFYLIFIGIVGNSGRYEWKGRTVR